MRQYCVYIMTNTRNGVLYTGVTSNLHRRVGEHRARLRPGFTTNYKTSRLVYCEIFSSPLNAIAREKQIKGWIRRRKIELIEAVNPEWRDLAEDWL